MSAERRGASENKQSFNIRQKMGGMQFDGMAPDSEPQDLPENRPQLALNVRYDGGISARPGFTQICDLGAAVTGMHDHQNGAPRGLYISLYNFVDDVSQGNQIVLYNKEQTPTSKVLTAYAEGTPSPIGIYGSNILFGQSSFLRAIRSIDVDEQPPIWQIPFAYGKISAVIEHEGEALVALWKDDTDPGGDCAVFSYDGTTFANSLTGLSIVRGFAKYRDRAIAIFDGTPNEIRVRDANGAWTTVTPAGGTVAVPYPDVCASYLDKCYIPTGNEDIFTLNETNTLTRLQPATTGVAAGSAVIGMATLDGNLYYLWLDNGSGQGARIGKYDGSNWNAYYKDFFNDGDAPNDCRAIKQYLGGLVVVGSPAVDVFGVYSSPGLNITGTWTGEILNTIGTDLSVTSALVY